MFSNTLLLKDLNNDALFLLFRNAHCNPDQENKGEPFFLDEIDYAHWVMAKSDIKMIWFYNYFRFTKTSTLLDRLEFVNTANKKVVMSRTYITDVAPATFCIDYYVPVEGGIQKDAVIQAAKDFAECRQCVLSLDTAGIITALEAEG